MGNDLAAMTDSENGGEYAEELYRTAQRSDLLPDLASIGAADVARYHEDGYLAVRSGLASQQVDEALAGLTSLVVEPRGADLQFESWAADRLHEFDGPTRLDAVRKLMGFVDHEPRLHAIAHDDELLALVARLAGTENLLMFQDMALLKPPGAGREKPWHQDNAFFALEPGSAPIVGVWIALDEATPENGCMHVIPGSHREGPVIHFRRRDWQICDTDVQTWRAVAVPLPPGGMLFFDALLHHGTPTNRSDRRRRALQFHYVSASAITVDEDRRLAIFGSEGKDVTC